MNLEFTQLYAIDDADPQDIIVDQRFSTVTIVIETLAIAAPPADLDDYDFVANGETDAVTGVTAGVVTLTFSPRGSFREFTTNGNAIDLTDAGMSFLTMTVLTRRIYVAITAAIGAGPNAATHFAVTISGNTGADF